MKITMDKVLAFAKTYEELKTKTLKLQTLYKLGKIVDIVEKETKFYNDHFAEICQTYGQKNEDGTLKFSDDGSMILVLPEKQKECNEKLSELISLEVELNDSVMLDIAELGDIELTPESFNGIKAFIK